MFQLETNRVLKFCYDASMMNSYYGGEDTVKNWVASPIAGSECQIKPYPTQANFKPYPTQAPVSCSVVVGGSGVFTQPGHNKPIHDVSLSQTFYDAVGSSSVSIIEECIVKKPSVVNEKGFNGSLPLHRACLRGDVTIVRLLLRNGADVNGCNDFSETPLHYACKRGSPVILQELIDHGADLRAEDRAGKGAIHHAAQTGSVMAIHYLIEVCGLNAHVRDRNLSTPLHVICAHGHVEAFEYFLRKERSDLWSRDAQGNTVLHIAASNGSSWMCWILLEKTGYQLLHSSNVDGCTPVDLAKQGTTAKYVEVVKMLAYYTNKSRQQNAAGQTFAGIQLTWYGLLVFPFVAYPAVILLASCFANRGPVTLVGLFFLIGFRLFHSHRINHISRPPSPAHAGMFISGLLYTMLCYYFVILPDAIHDLGQTFVTLSVFMTAVILYLYGKLMTTSPGSVLPSRSKSGFGGEICTIHDIAIGHVPAEYFCVKCEVCSLPLMLRAQIVRSETSMHCRLCNVCYDHIDHHCLYLYRCITAANHRLFILFNLACMVSMASFLYAAFVYAGTFFTGEFVVEQPNQFVGEVFASFPAVWSLTVLNAMSFAWGLWLMHDQLSAVSVGGRPAKGVLASGTKNWPTVQQRLANVARFLLKGQQPVRYISYIA